MAAETRELLLDTGSALFLDRGFTGTGIQDILREAGVPKGSFYHHFGSKEEFGLALIERYAAESVATLDGYLRDESLPHLGRLRRFFEDAAADLDDCECRGGCLMGTLGHELANVSEPIRRRVDALFDQWVLRLERCLAAARDAGELPPTADPRRLAEYCFLAWEGAMQQMRIRRCSTPLRTFLDTTFGTLLGTG